MSTIGFPLRVPLPVVTVPLLELKLPLFVIVPDAQVKPPVCSNVPPFPFVSVPVFVTGPSPVSPFPSAIDLRARVGAVADGDRVGEGAGDLDGGDPVDHA